MKQLPPNTCKVPIRDFAKKFICDGHLYLTAGEGKLFYLMKPGVLIETEFVKKHAKYNTVFDYVLVTDVEIKAKFSLMLKELKYFQYERDLKLKAFEIVKYFEEVFSSEQHFLNFALSCHEAFNAIPNEILLRMHETDMFLFRKALYSAAFSVIIGMANDFYDPMILKDFYNLTFSIDFGLCEESYSYYVAQACNHENQRPGSGRNWMFEEKASESELKVFLQHPEKSYTFLKNNPGVLSNPELAEVVLYQHELSNGKGFPRGIPKGLISTWESVVILADSMVQIQDEYQFETRVVPFMLSFQNEKLTDLPVGRVYKKLCDALSYFEGRKEGQA